MELSKKVSMKDEIDEIEEIKNSERINSENDAASPSMMPQLKVTKRPYKKVSNEMKRVLSNSITKGLCTRRSASLIFDVPYPTISNIYTKYVKTGSTENIKREIFKPKIFNEEHIKFLNDSLAENCASTLKDLRKLISDRFKIKVSVTTLCRNLSSFHFSIQNESRTIVPPLTEGRISACKTYCELFLEFNKHGRVLVYFDDANFKVSIRKFAKNTTTNPTLKIRQKRIMASLTNYALVHYKAYDKSDPESYYLQFLNTLFSILNHQNITGAILIMNETVLDKFEEIKIFTQQAGHELLLIPPHNPSFNPVEIMFTHWNDLIRSKNPSNDSELEALIEFFSDVVTTEYCSAYCLQVLDNVSKALKETL